MLFRSNLYQKIVGFNFVNEILQIVNKVFRYTRLYFLNMEKTLLMFNSLFYELTFRKNSLRFVNVYLLAYMLINIRLAAGSIYSGKEKTENGFKIKRFFLKFQRDYLDFVKSLFENCLCNLCTYFSDCCPFYLPLYFNIKYFKVKHAFKTYIFVKNALTILVTILKSKCQILLKIRYQFIEYSISLQIPKPIFKDKFVAFKPDIKFAIDYQGYYSFFFNVLNI